MKQPIKIGITMGDPAGIGPELCLRVLQNRELLQEFCPIVFGNAAVLRRVAKATNLPFSARILNLDELRKEDDPGPSVFDCELPSCESIAPAQVAAQAGAAAYVFIKAAICAALEGCIAAVTTCPVNKEALRLADVSFPGHTEIFAALTNTSRVCMMLTSDVLTVSMVTTHIGFSQVPSRMSIERIYDVINLTAAAMQRMKRRAPRLGVCGLNPHSGEHGLFGEREEEKLIIPAIEKARSAGLNVEGPIPPDTAFVPRHREKFDAIVCQYHDQGHIPFKMLAFDKGVNVTLGLPIVRTSVDHGTAFDIAWKGVANPESLYEAIRAAIRLSK
jgi:4-hydroxythreonine-4-phosphate dehydrogenase